MDSRVPLSPHELSTPTLATTHLAATDDPITYLLSREAELSNFPIGVMRRRLLSRV